MFDSSKLASTLINNLNETSQKHCDTGAVVRNQEIKYGFLVSATNNCNKQLINEPTRISESSSSIIDLIIVSDPERVTQSGVITCGLSDHNLIFCTRKVSRGQVSGKNVTQVRCMKSYDAVSFQKLLRDQDWFQVINCEDINAAWSNFKSIFFESGR